MRRPYTSHDVFAALGPWRWRLALRQGVAWSLWGLAGGTGVAVALLVVARFIPWPGALLWAGVSLAAGLVAGLAYAFATGPSRLEAARRTDRLIYLSDRLSTAWELRQVETPFARLQRENALESLRGREPGEAVRLWPGRRAFAPFLAGLALAGLLLALPNPMDHVIREREELQEQLARATEEVRKAGEELAEADSPLSAEERAALEESLANLEEALKRAEDTPQALAALSQAEEEIGGLRYPRAGHSETLQGIGGALAGSPVTEALGQALVSGDETALRQAMDALAGQLERMSPGELQELASALQQAANAAVQDEAVAGALRSAARAVASGEAGQGATPLTDLQDRLAALQEGAASQSAMNQTMASLRNARSFISGVALVQAGPGAGGGPGSGDGQGEGSGGAGSGAGDGGGSGSGDGRGDGGDGTDSGTGIGSGGGTGGSGAGDQPGARQGEQTGRLASEGETVFVPGKGPDVPTEVQTGPGAGAATGALRPYREVVGEYADQAREHMERAPVPVGYKDLVRRYFAELED